jgi:hypothetical protein
MHSEKVWPSVIERERMTSAGADNVEDASCGCTHTQKKQSHR